MGNAGRVLMIPKGDYNAATTYEMLDCVYYNGRSYVCKQTSTGNLPTNTTYWQVMTPDSSAEIQALTNYVGDKNVKNVLPLTIDGLKALNTGGTWNGNNYTVTGITFACDVVGGYVQKITINGTATATSNLELVGKYGAFAPNPYKNMVVNGCPSGGGDSSYSLPANVATSSAGTSPTYTIDTGDGAVIGDKDYCRIYIRVGNGYTANNVVFYPMIRDASITDPTYQPYAKTNLELTQDVAIENISDSFYDSLETGISVLDAAVYKQGKHIFGSFVVQSTDAFEVSSATAIMTLKYAPIVSINTFFALANAQWGSVMTLGYMYVNRASKSMTLEVRDADKHFAKIMIDYAIA